jgi:outer membrane protein assembly factor BamB
LVLAAAGLSAAAGDWPQWRGPYRNGHAASNEPPVATLPQTLAPRWKIPIGGGHSSPVVAGGKVLYADESEGQEVAHLLDAATGGELWRTAYARAYADEWGAGPRSTPFLDGDRAYVLSCRGEFRCLRLADGRELWRASFEQDFGVKFIGSRGAEGTAARRGNNGSGVIDGDRLVLPVGSPRDASLVCFDKRTGRVLWKVGNDEAAYSSPLVATLAGVRQVVAFTADALLGADLAEGRLLWRLPLRTDAKRHAATPVIVGDRVVVNSHTLGLLCFNIASDTGRWQATPAWARKDLRINLATPVLVDGHLYSPGANRDYICVEADTGRLRWAQAGFGGSRRDHASTMAVGSRLLVLTDTGTLLLLEADPDKYIERGRLQVCGNTWASPALADGRLYVRDARQLLCVDLAAAE